MYKIECSGVGKSFGYRNIFSDINHEFYPGCLNLISGKNGAGKSTLMRILATLIKQDSGKVIFDGDDIEENKNDFRQKIAYLPPSGQLYMDLTPWDNLLFFGNLRNISVSREDAVENLSRFQMERFIDLPLRYFSTGMVRKISLALCMQSNADIWLLDEPFSGLDSDSVELLCGIIDEQIEKSTNVVLITHQLPQSLGKPKTTLHLQN